MAEEPPFTLGYPQQYRTAAYLADLLLVDLFTIDQALDSIKIKKDEPIWVDPSSLWELMDVSNTLPDLYGPSFYRAAAEKEYLEMLYECMGLVRVDHKRCVEAGLHKCVHTIRVWVMELAPQIEDVRDHKAVVLLDRLNTVLDPTMPIDGSDGKRKTIHTIWTTLDDVIRLGSPEVGKPSPSDRRISKPTRRRKRQPRGVPAQGQSQAAAPQEKIRIPLNIDPEQPTRDAIPPRAQKAGEQYRQAVEALGVANPRDRDAYEKLEAAMKMSEEKADLPNFDTWTRNLRTYRQLTNQQKNHPRAGRKRNSGSVGRADQI